MIRVGILSTSHLVSHFGMKALQNVVVFFLFVDTTTVNRTVIQHVESYNSLPFHVDNLRNVATILKMPIKIRILAKKETESSLNQQTCRLIIQLMLNLIIYLKY